MGDSSAPSRVNRNTLVPAGLAVLAIVSAVTATWHAGDVLNELRNGGSNRGARLDKLEELQLGNWSREDMAVWLELLAAKNPSLVVPALPHRR